MQTGTGAEEVGQTEYTTGWSPNSDKVQFGHNQSTSDTQAAGMHVKAVRTQTASMHVNGVRTGAAGMYLNEREANDKYVRAPVPES